MFDACSKYSQEQRALATKQTTSSSFHSHTHGIHGNGIHGNGIHGNGIHGNGIGPIRLEIIAHMHGIATGFMAYNNHPYPQARPLDSGGY